MPGIDAYSTGTLHSHPKANFEMPVASADGLNVSADAYLTGDITLTSDISITETLSLCLNGYDINMGPYTITIEKDASISIYDCPINPDGAFIVGHGEKPAFEVFGKFNVTGGNFVSEGRPVIFNRGETTISGGSITGSDTQLVQTNGSCILGVTSGEIIASGTGSAIAMIEAPEDASAKKRDYNVAVGGGVITAEENSPGTIVVNAPKGRFVINTGANIVGKGCPAIKVESGNFDAYGAANVYSDTASAIVATGGNVGLYYANITSDEVYGVDISGDAELLLSGSLEIVGGNAGVHLAKGKVFSMSDYGFYGDVRISIHTEEVPSEGKPVPISTPCEAKHYSHFLSATPSSSISYTDRVIYNSYDGTVAHSHDGRNYVLALHGSYTDLSKNNYYLDGDLSCNGFYTGSVVNICLNGHTLNLANAIRLYPNSTLNIYDCQGTGKIQCNSTCITDINNGNARLIVHQGTIVSNNNAPVKLTGADSVIVKGGKIVSLLDGTSAIECTGPDNSVQVVSGSIEGIASAVNLVEGSVTVSGNPEGSLKGNCIIQGTGLKPGIITVDGSASFESQTADILLSQSKLLAAGAELSAGVKYSVLSDAQTDPVILSAYSEKDISGYFESADPAKAIVFNDENLMQLVRSLPASPASAEIHCGESAQFTIEYTGSAASYQWHVRNVDTGEAVSVDNSDSAEFSTPADLENGVYEVYCVVNDESGTYVGDILSLTVLKDTIENVSVTVDAQLEYTGEPVSIQPTASASTTLGRSVSFTYSLDDVDYAATLPAIGPEPGVYNIYYIAEAEGCDDVRGRLTVQITQPEQAQTEENNSSLTLSPRLVSIMVCTLILLVLCVIFIIQLIRKKSKK